MSAHGPAGDDAGQEDRPEDADEAPDDEVLDALAAVIAGTDGDPDDARTAARRLLGTDGS